MEGYAGERKRLVQDNQRGACQQNGNDNYLIAGETHLVFLSCVGIGRDGFELAVEACEFAEGFKPFDDLLLQLGSVGVFLEEGRKLCIDGGRFGAAFFREVDTEAAFVVFVLSAFDEARVLPRAGR